MKTLSGVKIGIVGTGKMGQALIKGLLDSGVSKSAIYALESDITTRQHVKDRFGIRVTPDNLEYISASDVIVIAVKPQQFHGLLSRLSIKINRQHLVISIAAGITLRWLERALPGVAIIRVMPNLPAMIGCGFSALAYGRKVRPLHKQMTLELFSAVGEAEELPEKYFDAITAVSGSGPAYLFFLAHIWQQAAKSLKLPEAIAAKAIRQTLKGSLKLLELSGDSPEALIGKVASKKGTTEAALKVLAKRKVSQAFSEALKAAARRSRELSWG